MIKGGGVSLPMTLEQLLQELRLARAELTAGWSQNRALTDKERRRLERIVLRLNTVKRGLVQHLDERVDTAEDRQWRV